MEILERYKKEECRKIRHFFDYSTTKMVSVEGVEEVAGVPSGTLKSILLVEGVFIADVHQLRALVNALARLSYRSCWDWDYIIKTDLHE